MARVAVGELDEEHERALEACPRMDAALRLAASLATARPGHGPGGERLLAATAVLHVLTTEPGLDPADGLLGRGVNIGAWQFLRAGSQGDTFAPRAATPSAFAVLRGAVAFDEQTLEHLDALGALVATWRATLPRPAAALPLIVISDFFALARDLSIAPGDLLLPLAELAVTHACAIAAVYPPTCDDLLPPAPPRAASWNVGAFGSVRLSVAARDGLAVSALPPEPAF